MIGDVFLPLAFKTVFIFTSYTVMYLLTEISLYDRFASVFGGGTVSVLYSGAMFMTGCGYLTFPCLSRFIADERKKQRAVYLAGQYF